jgi:Tol biopolymer transport system component
LVRTDGSGIKQVTHGTGAVKPVWSRDDRRVVYNSQTPRGSFIADLDAAGNVLATETMPELPSSQPVFDAECWSPDGKRILGNAFHEGRLQVAIYTLATRRYEMLFPNLQVTQSYYIDDRRILSADPQGCFMFDLRTRARSLLVAARGNAIGECLLSRDRRWLYVQRDEWESNIWLGSIKYQ